MASLTLLPSAVSGQVINLGAAAPFCLFTQAGAVTDGNSALKSNITGRLGTYTGAYSGFDPVYDTSIEGAPPQHETNQNTLLQVANAVDAALAEIDAQATSPVVLANALGGLTIPPGVYDMPAATSLSGTVTLDGMGQTNPLFIFKIGGAFTTTAPYQVVVTNGASLDNVYWRMGGAVTLTPGNTSVFRGIIIVLSAGAIHLGNGATLLGKALTQAGAMSLDNNRISNAELIPKPLPVVLTGFEATQQGTRARLRWATATEKDNAYFAVESSTDGKVFAEIGRVAGRGSSSQAQTYEWTDPHLAQYTAAVVYYRLRQQDANGGTSYSPVRAMALRPADGLFLQAYPNPAAHQFSVLMNVSQAGPATLKLLDTNGRLVMQRTLLLVPGSTTLALDETNELRPGLYTVQLQQGAQRHMLRLVRE